MNTTQAGAPASPSPAPALPPFRSLGRHVVPYYTQPEDALERAAILETFPAPAGTTDITLTIDPLTSLYPVTGGDDYYIATVTYKPRELCLESKSITDYRRRWRMEAIFCEHLATLICQDILRATQAEWCRVELAQKARGNIQITAAVLLENQEEQTSGLSTPQEGTPV